MNLVLAEIQMPEWGAPKYQLLGRPPRGCEGHFFCCRRTGSLESLRFFFVAKSSAFKQKMDRVWVTAAKQLSGGPSKPAAEGSKEFKFALRTVTTEQELVDRAKRFEEVLKGDQLPTYCTEKVVPFPTHP